MFYHIIFTINDVGNFFIYDKVMNTKQKVVVLRRINIHVDKVCLSPHVHSIYIYDGRNQKLKLVYIF